LKIIASAVLRECKQSARLLEALAAWLREQRACVECVPIDCMSPGGFGGSICTLHL
jgi:hypothetical protein